MISQPLKGKRVVVTRSVRGNKTWKKYLANHGTTVYEFPTIRTEPVELNAKLAHALMNIADFDMIIFTSAAGLRYMKSLAAKIGADISPRRMPPLAVIGLRSESTARRAGYHVTFFPSIASTGALVDELDNAVRGQSILLLRSDIASKELPEQLTAQGAKVTDVSIYRTVPLSDPDIAFEQAIVAGKIDYLTFASPSAVRGFCARISDPKILTAAKKIPAIALGTSVEKELALQAFASIRVAKKPTLEEIVAAITQ